ncbi:MAG: indolepyruvate oxidoreductase subunit beta family protein [Hyphomicrobiales bacterium]|nr:indolepyruvate oxidoreductase subunit beta family protein [Hyphomicrobiales bacterium]
MSASGPICVQVAALGGQGGGVLADWLDHAARVAGYPAQTTSIPGVAQRTGATTYYFELFPEREPAGRPVFSLFPDADDLDLMAALEPIEAGRALERGLITGRTTVITAAERIYSTAEKMVAGDGRVPVEDVIESLEKAGKRLIRLDVRGLARQSGGLGNAVLFGAIAGTGVLPLDHDHCRAAIRAGGKAVEANLAAFDAGLRAVAEGAAPPAPGDPDLTFEPAPAAFAVRVQDLPAPVRAIVGHGLARLVDYQDADYAQTYLDRLAPVFDLDGTPDRALSVEVARRLAAWMSAEDVIRVAQLKTRPGRLARIRGEVGVDADAPFSVTDYLKPGTEEIAHILPPALARAVLALPFARAGVGLKLRTSSPLGYALMKFLAGRKSWRPRSYGFAREAAAIDLWLTAVKAAAAVDGELALAVAELAVWARGYGDVRGRGLARLARLFEDWERRLQADPAAVRAAVEGALSDARNDPDGDCRAGAG